MSYNLITTYLENSSSKKNTVYLGKWCHNLNKKNILKSKFKNTVPYHWRNTKKLNKDFIYIEKLSEKILVKLSMSLNKIHGTNHNLKYWGIIIYPWLVQYISFLFDRWETCRLFIKRNKKKKFNTYEVKIKNFNKNCIDHLDFMEKTWGDEWNYLIFERIINFLSPNNLNQRIRLKYNPKFNIKKKNKFELKKIPIKISIFFDKVLSLFALRFNSIILDNLQFPILDYLKFCIFKGLIPAKFKNSFDEISSNNKKNVNSREHLNKFFLQRNREINFESFLNFSLIDDLPLSYLENFKELRTRAKKISKKKKVIITMHSNHWNDFFKIYIAEKKLLKSKVIVSDHGGGLHPKLNHYFKFSEKYYDKKLSYFKNNNKKFYLKLPPTLPIIKQKTDNSFIKDKFTILITDCIRYQSQCMSIPFFDAWIDQAKDIIYFIKNLDNNIKKKIKFRFKDCGKQNLFGNGDSAADIFKSLFGNDKIDVSSNGPTLFDTLNKSKLVITNYPQTVFSECLSLNVPTILIANPKVWQFEKKSMEIYQKLKKNKMAFSTFLDAKKHIKKIWKNPSLWWENKKVQEVRNCYLKTFFPVSDNWYNEWSNLLSRLKKNYE